jgi:hypothetical protein
VRDARERPQRLGDRVVPDSGGTRRCRRRRGVLAVVRAGEQRLGRKRIGGRELDSASQTGDRAPGSRHHSDVVVALVLEEAQLRGTVRLERPVTIEVVGFEVDEHRNARAELVDVLELEARELADDPGTGRDAGVEVAELALLLVAGQDELPPGRLEDRAEQPGRRRLPVRSGNSEDRVAEQPVAELDLAPDEDPAPARLGDERVLAGHARALDQQLHAVERRVVFGHRALPGLSVDRGHGHAVPLERVGGRPAGPPQPEHEGRPRQRNQRMKSKK